MIASGHRGGYLETSGDKPMTQSYEIIEHSYDVVTVGAGGAGLWKIISIAHRNRATVGHSI